MTLYMVCGLPGTGKTTIAKELAKLTGGIVLRTDEIRKQILTDPKYTPEEKGRVYEAMLRTAGSMLRVGRDVILDATFHKEREREAAGRIARKAGKKLAVIEARCDEKTVMEHLRKREGKGDASDADFKVYKKIEKEWEPIEEKHFVIVTGRGRTKSEVKEIVGKMD